MPGPGTRDQQEDSQGPRLGRQARGPGPGPDGQGDDGNSAVRGMWNLLSRIELVAPGQLPAQLEQWPTTVQDSILRQRAPGQ
jgi:hypothetical protein